ncbi:glycine oxidase [Pararhizobium polonicum]|uniref:Glycine oxidase n=1 Tax=Pararhizobium polonicum TaxID=1612624 RepID=A0A1C7P5Q1_9HYPH|nr:glycine oxidase ThiO [Pararhizobium polonicum]OBZ96579.1 glycine oxidase [Pararhizobium polonicum]
MRVLIRGAGVAGLTLAHELAAKGVAVELAETSSRPGGGASWFAGGMLAPWCERESAPETVLTLGRGAADWWDAALPGHVTRKGTLVVAPPRDTAELTRFADRTSGFDWLDADDIDALEPGLAGRFRKALLFRGEAHLDPRRALNALHGKLAAMGVRFHFNAAMDFPDAGFDCVIDCTGASAIGQAEDLRGVRGEMLMLQTPEVTLSRPVRLLHPRIPLYIVPRSDGRFMVGATMIESADDGPISARSLMELLNATYALHPSFGEARVIETGTGVRPSYPDNLPRIGVDGRTIRVNGFYRHGFLLAPSVARDVATQIISPSKTKHLPSTGPFKPAAATERKTATHLKIGASR